MSVTRKFCELPLTRLPRKVKRQASKTSVSYETSSKSEARPIQTQSHLRFAPSTRAISAEGCARPIQNAISPAFRALDTHDLRRGLRRTGPKRNLACISRPRRARSPQRVAPDKSKTQSHLHFAPSTRTIFAEGCVSWCSGSGLKRKKRRATGYADVSCADVKM